MKGVAVEGRQGRSSWDMKGTRSWAAEEDRLGESSWDMRVTKRLEAKEDRLGKSRLDMKGIKRWVAKVDSAPWTSLEESVQQRRKGLRLMSPSSRLRTVEYDY